MGYHSPLTEDEADGFVYLAKSDTGHFKIGRSVTPDKRIKHFDTQMPVEVREWHFFRADDYVEAEKTLHEICDEHGEHINGEWWDLPEYMIWWIQDILFYEDGEFYGGDVFQEGPLEPPSESYGNYAQLFGARTGRAAPANTGAHPSRLQR